MNFKSLSLFLGTLAVAQARVGSDEQQEHRGLGWGYMGASNSQGASDWATRCCGQDDNANCRCPICHFDIWGNLERWDHKCADAGFGALDDIVDTAVGAGSFTTLVDLVTLAELGETLKSPGPFTVFAPTDEAFAALDADTVAFLTSPEGKQRLTEILTYHVVPGKVLAADLSDGLEAATVESSTVAFSGIADGMPQVNGIDIIQTDVVASNGVIHVISGVLIPEEPQPQINFVSPNSQPNLQLSRSPP